MRDKNRDTRAWEAGWDGHASAQRARLARLTLPEKLQWLEEAQQVISHLHGQAVRATDDPSHGGQSASAP